MTRDGWIVLAICWVIASFPVAAVIGQKLKRREAGIEALADATRERRSCGCEWVGAGPGRDPVWVPCDGHADRLLRAAQDGEDTAR